MKDYKNYGLTCSLMSILAGVNKSTISRMLASEKARPLTVAKGIVDDPIDEGKLPPSYIQKITIENTHTEKGVCAEIQSINLEQEMLDLWNEIVQKENPPCRMTPVRKETLTKLLETEFSGNLEQWENVCKQIASNDFFDGEGGSWLAD